MGNDEVTAGIDVQALLNRARTLCTPSLQDAVARLASPLDTVCSYHFGWTDVHGKPTAGDPGKALRPALALLSVEAAGASEEIGVPGGVAVELVHNFSLLHDDLMDRDEERRHRATVWSIFGDEKAVLAGDALLTLAIEVLLDAGLNGRVAPADVGRSIRRLTGASHKLIDGQAEDLDLERRDRVAIEECLQMAGNKTGALMAASSSIGAVLAGASDGAADALERYGHHLGLAFQAVDDLLGIWGATEITGKPRWSDLRRRKKSLPVTAALAAECSAAEELAELLARPQGPEQCHEQLATCGSLIIDAGGQEWTRQEAGRQREAALTALNAVDMPSLVREKFTAVADHIVARQELIDVVNRG